MKNYSIATLGGGCFWCLEAVFQELKGIHSVVSGFSGGHVDNPSYQDVIAKSTGHAEVVQLEFDPEIIGFREILQVFFTIHDPTTLNRQGNDVGPQYRSVIFFHNEEQEMTAREVIAEFEQQSVWDAPFVTEISAFTDFYRAEDYHQNYYRDNPLAGYCMVVIRPKVQKFRKVFFDKLKK